MRNLLNLRRILFTGFLLLILTETYGQNNAITLNRWSFKSIQDKRWLKSKVPGSVYTDLIHHQIIKDPFYSDEEKNVQWVDTCTWVYQTEFPSDPNWLKQQQVDLVFEGLDTYASIYLNDQCLGATDNMFRTWTFPVKKYLLQKRKNILKVVFDPALKMTKQKADKILPLIYPDHPRVHTRKAAYQFGWDWGPTLIGAGIWKPVTLMAYDKTSPLQTLQQTRDAQYQAWIPEITHHQNLDSIGRSFHFEKNEKPIYMLGANWIPLTPFPGNTTRADYRKWLMLAKEANMNLLRVWGGGIYESDDFYELCDSMGIYVWQDFMFACAMYPANQNMLTNIKEEVRQQVMRLRHHPCIILWCGNNEIDEAWKNWGWQNAYGLHGKDSVKIAEDYKRLFEDSLRSWIKVWDPKRAYVSGSPEIGWGHPESFNQGDSHYWGVWWGLQDWEEFKTHTGRFVSEYGMQSLSDNAVWKKYLQPHEKTQNHPSFRWHQKANQGFEKLNHYIDRYMMDSNQRKNLSLEDYVYVSQCMQSFILENIIQVHRKNSPKNMGTVLWQLNDVWPAVSWSIANVDGTPKLAWYAVKRAYSGLTTNQISPKEVKWKNPELKIISVDENLLCIESKANAGFVTIIPSVGSYRFSDNGFSMKAGEVRCIEIRRLDGSKTKTEFRLKNWHDIFSQ